MARRGAETGRPRQTKWVRYQGDHFGNGFGFGGPEGKAVAKYRIYLGKEKRADCKWKRRSGEGYCAVDEVALCAHGRDNVVGMSGEIELIV
jgi:hypothetical protein